MSIPKLGKGAKVESKKMIMVITGKTKTAYLGYIQYKGKPVGQCSLLFEMFTNPHYKDGIVIKAEGEGDLEEYVK